MVNESLKNRIAEVLQTGGREADGYSSSAATEIVVQPRGPGTTAEAVRNMGSRLGELAPSIWANLMDEIEKESISFEELTHIMGSVLLRVELREQGEQLNVRRARANLRIRRFSSSCGGWRP